ncbi:MAG TPA: NmrA family NAD(P)-binding protein [Vicinamibacterales bacterium]|nr:NmrA family NAD(P)-binding protein [Vicinamibacterales bacterium]
MVLIVGATGQLGSRIARELLSRRVAVRALCRPSSGAGALRRMGAEIAIGDLRDAGSLAAACVGADTVITTATSARRGGEDTIAGVDVAGTRALVDAARAAGVGHFVYTSVYSAAAGSPDAFMAAKGTSEEYLRASGLPWTVLAPDAFMESWPGAIVGARAMAGQPVVLVGDATKRHAYVAEHDVAQVAVAAVLGNLAARNRRLAIGGPAALSWRDVIETYERALGTTIEVRLVRPGEAVAGVSDALLALLALYETFDSVFNASALFAECNVPQTTLEAWVRASLASTRRRI